MLGDRCLDIFALAVYDRLQFIDLFLESFDLHYLLLSTLSKEVSLFLCIIYIVPHVCQLKLLLQLVHVGVTAISVHQLFVNVFVFT